ncbi:MAG: DegV family protein [Oscillospiraceae bacterium]|jgi:DegV family protein with EDD domain|nr:DegV family protein [Oscillospiraceae bacterium]
MKVKILCDSTMDISPKVKEKYGIGINPLTIVLGDKAYKDGVEISPKEIFDFVGAGKGTSKTTAINIEEYREFYSKHIDGDTSGIVHLILSSELSAGYFNSMIAAEEFDNVFPIDSMSLSTGGGWLAIYAAELADEGRSAAEIAQIIKAKAANVDASFVVDTVDYLRAGGRCGGLAAFGANLLGLHPCLELRGGKIEVGKKYRGNIKKVIRQYVEEKLKDVQGIDPRRAIVSHTFFDDPEFVEEIIGLVGTYQPFKEILNCPAGCTISNHCGPGTLGVLFCMR